MNEGGSYVASARVSYGTNEEQEELQEEAAPAHPGEPLMSTGFVPELWQTRHLAAQRTSTLNDNF